MNSCTPDGDPNRGDPTRPARDAAPAPAGAANHAEVHEQRIAGSVHPEQFTEPQPYQPTNLMDPNRPVDER